jgi:hypothetical protein
MNSDGTVARRVEGAVAPDGEPIPAVRPGLRSLRDRRYGTS